MAEARAVVKDNIAGRARVTPSGRVSPVGSGRRRASMARRGPGGRGNGGLGRPIHLHFSRSSSRSLLPRCWFGDGAGAADETRQCPKSILLRWPISDNRRSNSCRPPRGAPPSSLASKAGVDDQDISFKSLLKDG